jgi:hypothetical protein
MTMAQLSERSTRSLGIRVAELNRIDTAVLAAAKTGVPLPSFEVIFDVLIGASIASAEVIDAHGASSMPIKVHNKLLRLQCAATDLLTSLKVYTILKSTRAPAASAVCRAECIEQATSEDYHRR